MTSDKYHIHPGRHVECPLNMQIIHCGLKAASESSILSFTCPSSFTLRPQACNQVRFFRKHMTMQFILSRWTIDNATAQALPVSDQFQFHFFCALRVLHAVKVSESCMQISLHFHCVSRLPLRFALSSSQSSSRGRPLLGITLGTGSVLLLGWAAWQISSL